MIRSASARQLPLIAILYLIEMKEFKRPELKERSP